MSNAIEGLQPVLVWKYFAEIAKIPDGVYVFEDFLDNDASTRTDR